ncbi:MAG: hypothetical protein QM845_11080 [Verrucomicrobiota bacterium]|nr:hypothetical protein [Verrucomicrobiota bacterium]
MRFLLSLFLVLAIASCERPGKDHGITDDVRAKNALKAALVEARLVAYDNKDNMNSISDLLMLMEQQGHMSPLLTYGRSNIFLNPQTAIWRESSLSNRSEASEFAIVIRRNTNDYACVTFDARFVKENRRPAKWCE